MRSCLKKNSKKHFKQNECMSYDIQIRHKLKKTTFHVCIRIRHQLHCFIAICSPPSHTLILKEVCVEDELRLLQVQ